MLLNGRYVKGYSHPQTKQCRPHRMIQGMAPGGKPYGLLEVKISHK